MAATEAASASPGSGPIPRRQARGLKGTIRSPESASLTFPAMEPAPGTGPTLRTASPMRWKRSHARRSSESPYSMPTIQSRAGPRSSPSTNAEISSFAWGSCTVG